jgi:transcriptional regulator with XRE-family HTH domain
MTYEDNNIDLGRIIKQRRFALVLTLSELSARSGVSSSHLGRMERGERFPSARILKRIASPLQFKENELFSLAGYLSSQFSAEAKIVSGNDGQLDPIVAKMLTQEPIEVQRAVIAILIILKSITRSIP